MESDKMTIALSRDILTQLPTSVAAPAYDPDTLSAGILHFGVGNFHRAHQAVYLDDLFNLGVDRDWAIVGAGVRAADGAMRTTLERQDWLTTVVEQEADYSAARITAAMIDFVTPGDAGAIIARLSDPAIRIVSMTITEGGYYIDPATQAFNASHPDIVWDAEHRSEPRTTFGLILSGLEQRRKNGIPPFSVMSCDNIPHNGHVTQNAIVGLAQLIDAELAAWVKASVAFPSGMVDRITPATSARERQLLEDGFGIDDRAPVFCETFKQWVLEDNFPMGRPALEKVGVTFVSDVTPFELMKIRILNGGHATIAYPAALLDIHFVHEAMEDTSVRRFLEKLELDEIIPIVPPVPDTNLVDYFRLIERRFANPKIGDTVPRLCFDGANRQPKFILPTVRDRLAAGGSVRGLALVSALWCRYCYGETDSGKPVVITDPEHERLIAKAKIAKFDPGAWLTMDDVYGDLGTDPAFESEFSRSLKEIWAIGTRNTLERYIAS